MTEDFPKLFLHVIRYRKKNSIVPKNSNRLVAKCHLFHVQKPRLEYYSNQSN